EDGIRDRNVTGVQTCALPIFRDERPQFVDEPRPGGGAGALEVLEAAESPVGEGGVECVQDRGALVVGGAGSWLRHEREGIWPTGAVARRAVGDDLARRRNLGTVLEHFRSWPV